MPRSIHALALSRVLLTALLAPVGSVALAQNPPAAAPRLTPPVAEGRMRVDTLHGEVRRDDYFWLRDKTDPAVRTYLEAENAYTVVGDNLGLVVRRCPLHERIRLGQRERELGGVEREDDAGSAEQPG